MSKLAEVPFNKASLFIFRPCRRRQPSLKIALVCLLLLFVVVVVVVLFFLGGEAEAEGGCSFETVQSLYVTVLCCE